MILRWIYNIWNFLLKFVGYILLIALFIGAIFVGVLQLPMSKNYINAQITNAFNEQYEGSISIGSLEGFIPFRARLNDVAFSTPGESPEQTLSADHLYISVDIWQLIQGGINITELDLQSPTLVLKRDESGLNLQKIFSRKISQQDTERTSNFINNFSIFAPQILVENGIVEVDQSMNSITRIEIPDPLYVSNLDASFFVESMENQQFIEINSFTANTNVDEFEELSLDAQLFTDGYFLELNGLDFRTNNSVFQLSAEASPINLFEPNVEDQLLEATFSLNLERVNLSADLLNRVETTYQKWTYPLEFSGSVNGTLDSLYVDNLQLINGDSYLNADGILTSIRNEDFNYDFSLSNLVLSPEKIRQLFPEEQQQPMDLSGYGSPVLQGEIIGSLNFLQAQLELETDIGNAEFDTDFKFTDDQNFTLIAELDSLDISPFLHDSLGSTILNGSITADGSGYDRSASAETIVRLSDSKIKTHPIQELTSELSYVNNTGEYSLNIRNNQTQGTASGTFGLGSPGQFSIEAVAQQLDMTTYFPNLPYDTAVFNGRVSANAEGSGMDDIFGRISIEVNEAIIDADTLRSHQFYADINNPSDGQTREFRMTSSFLNLNLAGSLFPEQLAGAASYWYDFIAEQINEELFFEKKLAPLKLPQSFANASFDEAADLSVQLSSRDLNLLKTYFPDLPSIESSASINLNINATRDILTVNGTFFDDSLSVNSSRFGDVGITLTSNIKYGEELKTGSLLDLQMNSPDLILNDQYNISGASVNLSLRDSLITSRQQIDGALENLFYLGETTSIWSGDQIHTTIDTLSIGSDIYTWHSNGTPGVIYKRDGSLTLDQFIVESNEDFFEVDGTFSSSYEDSVTYNISNFNLGRVSNLIGGRIQFDGVLDGEFTTRALTQIPSIQGDLSVRDGRINNRVVGDVTLQSRFNSEEDRFDTEIHLYTDPDKYVDYLEANDGIGHDLYFNGYFKTPDEENVNGAEDLVYFDADLREIDMWIVTLIVPNIITEMEGSATGSGFFKIDNDGYNYESSFEVEDVYGLPAFTNVPYTLGGELIFNREDGLLFEEVRMDDGRGGRGIFSGQVDLNDFGPTNTLDLRMELNNLRFMNNIQDPNVPFYADLTGSGVAVLDGSSSSPSLRSITPINLSSRSNISIPLQEETELQQDRRFIQFVDSFENLNPVNIGNNGNGSSSENEEGEVDLSFLELFNMNMQFVANNPVQFQLIFDPVTNDILNATGTGQITLILDDQDLSMYGRFNISGGEYQFVGGDIFTRRFAIQDGGTISWQGDLADASLNVTAAYRARPDISTLLPTGTNFQRIPIELILQIGGTISELENNFYFQLPTGIEGTQDPTITAQINRLNQNEDEKVLQAFGILLTGNFVPSDELQNPEFGNVTGTNALVNPLVSSQIISPLLSNQINSLLRSDITFDVDFNLNAFNEVDLGVALRLFNDRIVLRREGQITGESEIGDLGATYRINQIFSITAFHRQDITLSNRSETESRQTQEMNGMGLEAQFQFNTWQNLKNRIFSSFRKLFGLKEKDPESDEESDSLAEN